MHCRTPLHALQRQPANTLIVVFAAAVSYLLLHIDHRLHWRAQESAGGAT